MNEKRIRTYRGVTIRRQGLSWYVPDPTHALGERWFNTLADAREWIRSR